jgi:hypothetical protein
MKTDEWKRIETTDAARAALAKIKDYKSMEHVRKARLGRSRGRSLAEI